MGARIQRSPSRAATSIATFPPPNPPTLPAIASMSQSQEVQDGRSQSLEQYESIGAISWDVPVADDAANRLNKELEHMAAELRRQAETLRSYASIDSLRRLERCRLTAFSGHIIMPAGW